MSSSYLTIKDIAAHFGSSYDFARDLVQGRIPHLKFGRRRLVKQEDFEKFLADNTVQPGTREPRPTPFISSAQQREKARKEWHRSRRAAQPGKGEIT